MPENNQSDSRVTGNMGSNGRPGTGGEAQAGHVGKPSPVTVRSVLPPPPPPPRKK